MVNLVVIMIKLKNFLMAGKHFSFYFFKGLNGTELLVAKQQLVQSRQQHVSSLACFRRLT